MDISLILNIIFGSTSVISIIGFFIYRKQNKELKNNEVKKDDAETQEKQMNLAELYKDKVLDLIEQVSKKQDSGNHNQTRILQKLDTLDSRTDGIESRLGDVVVYLNGDFQDFLKRQHKPRKHPNPELQKTIKPKKEDGKAVKA